ncbi:helix-turn-helix domain-containing protein [Escherichia coli]|uniref:helix-turn-helix domain-containing protein n=1 Tax=Escherichia coli TaxID=562 RepID=UPI003A5CFBE4
MERELIVERTRAGLDAARAEGRIGGRRPKYQEETWQQMRRLLENGIPVSRLQSSMMLLFPRFIKSFLRHHFNPKPWFKRTWHKR